MVSYDSISKLLQEHLSTNETLRAKQLMKEMKKAKNEGVFTKDFLLEIIEWKSPRSKGYWKSNNKEYVREISKRFFQLKDDKNRMRCLRELHGVGVPVATAILTLSDPKNYCIIDYHAWQLLYDYGLVTEKEDGNNLGVKNWLQFLEIIRQLAQKFQVKARDIERTIFDYHKGKVNNNLENKCH